MRADQRDLPPSNTSKGSTHLQRLDFASNKRRGSRTALTAQRSDLAVAQMSAKKRTSRLAIIGVLALLWVSALVTRMFSLQVSDFKTWNEWATKQHVTKIEVASERGRILDRNGKLLAVSVPAGSVFLRPKLVKAAEKAPEHLAKLLELDRSFVTKKINSDQPFVWLKRQLPRYVTDQIEGLKLSGVGVVMEARRFYPHNQAASALIGKVGVDGSGLSGIEGVYEKRLHVAHTQLKATKDAFGNVVHIAAENPSATFQVPKGDALRLTIDADLQLIMDQEVERGRADAKAKHAMAVMIDSATGEIIALSQSPSHNFNISSDPSKDALRNHLVEAVFEPGSVMKPIVASAAVDLGLITPTEMINCENGRFSFGSHTIKDVHPSGTISVADIVIRSSNIGMTKIGMKMGNERLYSYLTNFGFGKRSGLGLPGESGGILRPVNSWSKVDLATHSFGQGIAVTPLQVVRAVAAIANGGVLPNLSVVQGTDLVTGGHRVLSERAAKIGQDMMYGVTEDKHGTGGKSLVAGVRIGGKTGTAQKAVKGGRGYATGLYVASFVGFVDGTPLGVKRNLTAMVVVDEPHAGSIYGGTLAAPVFQKIIDRSLKFLATRSDLEEPQESGRSPQIREEDELESLPPEIDLPQIDFSGRHTQLQPVGLGKKGR